MQHGNIPRPGAKYWTLLSWIVLTDGCFSRKVTATSSQTLTPASSWGGGFPQSPRATVVDQSESVSSLPSCTGFSCS